MTVGASLLEFIVFPTGDIPGPRQSEGEIKALIDQHGERFIKPVLNRGVAKKGKAGLPACARRLSTGVLPSGIQAMIFQILYKVISSTSSARPVVYD
jgi:hypothetical protein